MSRVLSRPQTFFSSNTDRKLLDVNTLECINVPPCMSDFNFFRSQIHHVTVSHETVSGQNSSQMRKCPLLLLQLNAFTKICAEI